MVVALMVLSESQGHAPDIRLWEGNSEKADVNEFQTWSFLKLYLANRTGTCLNLISSNSSCFTKCFRLQGDSIVDSGSNLTGTTRKSLVRVMSPPE